MTQESTIHSSSGNVYIDLGLPVGKAAVLALRANLMGRLRLLIREEGWTPAEAAKRFGITQSRVSELLDGKWDTFSLEMLIQLAARAGRKLELTLHS